MNILSTPAAVQACRNMVMKDFDKFLYPTKVRGMD